MANRYSIPGFFEDVEVVDGKIKEPGFLGKTLYVIKGTEIKEPGFLGKTILVIKDGKIQKPGFLGKTLFYIDETGAVKEPKLFGRTVGAFPLYPGMGPRGRGSEAREKPSEGKPSGTPQRATTPTPRYEREETLAQLEERLDRESGYSADYTNCKPEAKKITVPAKYKKLTSIAPALRSVETVVIHAGVTAINQSSVHCLKAYIVDENNPKYVSVDGIIYTKDMTVVVAVPDEVDMSTFRFPETVKGIRNGAFHRDFDTFLYQKNIQFPGNVAVKKDYVIEEGNPFLKTVDGVLYSADGKILFNAPRRKKLGSLRIPDGLLTIKEGAFWGARVDTVVLPQGLQTIEANAFLDSKMTKVYIPASVETIGNWAFSRVSGLLVECGASGKGPDWSDKWIEDVFGKYAPNVMFGVAEPDF